MVESAVNQDPSGLAEGEPQIAEDPRNPATLFYDYTTMNYPPTKLTPPKAPCGGQASTDTGTSWHNAFVETPSTGVVVGCSDAVAAYGPDGTLYAGGIVIASYKLVTDCTAPGVTKFGSLCLELSAYDGIVRSTDNGRTWGPAVKTMGSSTAGTFDFAPGSGNPVQTFDRPWLAVDQSNGTVYAIGHNIADHEGFVTTSTNKAKSFGTIYAIDSPSYPLGGTGGGDIAAAQGVLAATYSASSAPGAKCPCVVFETSTDHGSKWTRYVIPTVDGSQQPFPYVTADSGSKGHFAVTLLNASGTENQVYVTANAGHTWQGPTNVAEAPKDQQFKQWISYGPTGELALVWRTWHGPPTTSPYDVWAAIGKEESGKLVFSKPLHVNSSLAGYPPGYLAGDDFSFILMDHHYVHVGWGDSRNGTPESYYARIPISTFKWAS